MASLKHDTPGNRHFSTNKDSKMMLIFCFLQIVFMIFQSKVRSLEVPLLCQSFAAERDMRESRSSACSL